MREPDADGLRPLPLTLVSVTKSSVPPAVAALKPQLDQLQPPATRVALAGTVALEGSCPGRHTVDDACPRRGTGGGTPVAMCADHDDDRTGNNSNIMGGYDDNGRPEMRTRADNGSGIACTRTNGANPTYSCRTLTGE